MQRKPLSKAPVAVHIPTLHSNTHTHTHTHTRTWTHMKIWSLNINPGWVDFPWPIANNKHLTPGNHPHPYPHNTYVHPLTLVPFSPLLLHQFRIIILTGLYQDHTTKIQDYISLVKIYIIISIIIPHIAPDLQRICWHFPHFPTKFLNFPALLLSRYDLQTPNWNGRRECFELMTQNSMYLHPQVKYLRPVWAQKEHAR